MVFKRAFKGLKKVAKRGVRAAAGVARGVASGKTPMAAVRAQVHKELAAITGQGAYRVRRATGRRTIRGRGDYELDGAPGSIMNPRTAFEPRVKNEMGKIRVARSEYLGDILSADSLTGSATPFTLQNYFVNPGLDLANGGASNWLAPIGASFQQYRYEQAVFEFRTTSGSAISSTNATLGTIIMAGNYDASKPNYQNKQQMMDSQFAVSGAPSKSIMYPLECKSELQSLKLWDIRTNQLLPQQSQNTYDFVNFQIATQGMQAASSNLGELWFHYDLCLEKTNTGSAGTTLRTANYTWTNNITGQGTAPTSVNPVGDATTKWVASKGNQLPLTFDIPDQQYVLPYQIQQGTYLIELYLRGSTTTGAGSSLFQFTPSLTGLTNCIFSPNSSSQLANFQISLTLDSASIMYSQAYFTVNSEGQNFVDGNEHGINIYGGTWPTSLDDVQIIITELNPNAIGNGV